uniref:Uncharacterized protein n=1 Tax=Zea mays TaxID=4577 RepID=C4IZV5_MAIZE|nr:unknown [Zea mays]
MANSKDTRLQPPSPPTTLSASAVSGNRGNILNASNFHPRTSKSPESRLSTRSRGLGLVASSCTKLNVQRGDTELLATLCNILSSKHSSIRRRLITISLNLHATSDPNQSFPPRQISDMNEGVIEGCKDVSNTKDKLSFTDSGSKGNVLLLGLPGLPPRHGCVDRRVTGAELAWG